MITTTNNKELSQTTKPGQSTLGQHSVKPPVKPENRASQTWSNLVKPKTFPPFPVTHSPRHSAADDQGSRPCRARVGRKHDHVPHGTLTFCTVSARFLHRFSHYLALIINHLPKTLHRDTLAHFCSP